jgi:hypothetical protein
MTNGRATERLPSLPPTLGDGNHAQERSQWRLISVLFETDARHVPPTFGTSQKMPVA